MQWCASTRTRSSSTSVTRARGSSPRNELSIRKSVNPNEEVEIGEEVDALVLTKEDQDGRLILSKKRARFERAWRRIEAAAESGEPVDGSVIEVVKGGLIIDLGVRGFLPASLVDIRRVPNLDEYLGQTIECKVIELNRPRNNVVLSRRAVLEEERKEQRQAILERLQPGLIIEGQISNIVEFGAFVDLDGIDGLIHISELSWSHVNHPSEILNIGDTVQVKVLDIDRDRQRISLGLKQTQEDPWQRVVDTYPVGDELEGAVTKVVAFGAFVEILDGVEGLVHISELAQQHVENPREIVPPGDDVQVKILEIDSERRRLSLSIKRVEDQILPRRAARGRRRRPGRHARARPVRGRLRRRRARRRSRRPTTCREPRPAAEERRRGRAPRPAAEAPEAEAPVEPSEPSRRAPSPSPTEPVAEPSPRPSRVRAEPSPTPTEPTGAAVADAAPPVRRPDRRDRRRASPRRWRRSSGWARPRCRPTPSCTSCTRGPEVRDAVVARWGTDVAPGGGRRPRRGRPPRVRLARRARLARGPALAAGRRAHGRLARGRVGRATRRRRRSWSRRRCCSRPAWNAAYDATIAVVADEDVRAQRAAARGHGRSTSGPRASSRRTRRRHGRLRRPQRPGIVDALEHELVRRP